MSRPLRIEFDGAWYHVMNRGLGRRDIVRSDKDRQLFFEILSETISTFSIEIHAFTLMDNHYHLLLHTPHAGLSRAMRHLNGVYTQRVNKNWSSDGPIFRGRYKAILVDSDEYLLELVRYIHLNPIRARLCKLPGEYRWSSHRSYLRKKERPDWLVTEEVLFHFGSDELKAGRKLDDFVLEGVPERFYEALKRGRYILGTKGFAEWVYQNYVDREKKEVPLKERKPKPRVPVRLIMQHVSHMYDIPVKEIRRSQSGLKNDARSMTAYLIRRLTGLQQREIAKWLNVTEANTVAQMQYRFDHRLGKEARLNKLVKMAKNAILSTIKT